MFFANFKYRLAGSYITSTISLILVLLIAGILFLTIFNARDLSRKTKESITLTVIIKESATEVEITEIENILEVADFTKDVNFVPKEDAAKELQEELGEDFESILDYNPLPNTYEIKLLADYTNLDSITVIEQIIKQNTIVEDVYYHKALVNTVDKKLKTLVFVLTFLGFLIFIIAGFLINNTIRLVIYSKRFTIKTMQLVGATNKFIIKPFIINSFIQGAISSFIAILILIISILFLQKNIVEIFVISNLGIVFFITFIFGLIITSFSTYFSINKYLNSGIDNLYY